VVTQNLFDRKLLKAFKTRALTHFAKHSFLHHEIANRIAENISFLNRKFEKILEIGAMDEELQHLILQGMKANYTFAPDEENLNLQPESFDLIVSNLNLHLINEIPQFLLQIKEALKPGGVFIASFFGEENLRELAHVLHESEMEIYAGVSPRMPPTIDVKTAAMLLQKAGFADPISEFEKIEVDYSKPINLLRDLKMMGQSNVLQKRSRRFFTKKFLQKISDNYCKLYGQGDLGVKATFEIVTITGWK
jgi:NADH dehydrogenase [ubiquinone] 1 alpha subcomplex assembly factor 5